MLEELLEKGLEGLEACENSCQLLEWFGCFLRTDFASFSLNGVACASAKYQAESSHDYSSSALELLH